MQKQSPLQYQFNSFLHLFPQTQFIAPLSSLCEKIGGYHVQVNLFRIKLVFFPFCVILPMNSVSNKISVERKFSQEAHLIPFFDGESRQMHSVPYRSEETFFSRVQEIMQEGRLQGRKKIHYFFLTNWKSNSHNFFFKFHTVSQNT